jgi:hypothetical protein
MTDDSILVLRAELETLQIKVGVLEAMIITNPELKRVYDALYEAVLKQQRITEDSDQLWMRKPN